MSIPCQPLVFLPDVEALPSLGVASMAKLYPEGRIGQAKVVMTFYIIPSNKYSHTSMAD